MLDPDLHSLMYDFSIVYIRIKALIGYECEELVGTSLYMYHHALDSEVVEKAYKDCKLALL